MDIRELLIKVGYTDLRDFGKEWRTRPLYRTSGNVTSLAINKSTGQWYDFSDRAGGGLVRLVQLSLGLHSFQEAKVVVGDVSQLNSVNVHRYELTDVKKFDKNLLIKLHKDHSYWENRKISKRIVEIFQGGTTNNGRMARRYVFPIFDDKDFLVGFSGRTLVDSDIKWKHIGSKTSWCYPIKWNLDIIREKKEVILVESIGDMLALWQCGIKNVVVTFGVDISHAVIELCLKTDIRRIIIAFNNDKDNEFVGNEAAEDGQILLRKFFDEDQIIIGIPESKDFGEMTPEQISLWQKKYQKS